MIHDEQAGTLMQECGHQFSQQFGVQGIGGPYGYRNGFKTIENHCGGEAGASSVFSDCIVQNYPGSFACKWVGCSRASAAFRGITGSCVDLFQRRSMTLH